MNAPVVKKVVHDGTDGFDIYECLIIPHDSPFLNILGIVESSLCLFCGFLYAWIAHFGISGGMESVVWFAEIIFSL